jgi:hypothetical protein
MAKLLNEINSMPNVAGALAGWLSKLRIGIVKQTIVDGLPVDNELQFDFVGAVQPLSARKLEFKPEGLRAFKWLQIYCQAGTLELKEGDRIVYAGERFKVMADLDYRLNGYVEYHVVKDYEYANISR